jgi:sugar phosphate isomerase/epimerase
MMKLSTMTNLFYPKEPDCTDGFARSLRRTHEIGFDAIDFCMCPMQRGETELCRDDWEAHLEKIVAVRDELKLDIAQSHLPYPKVAVRRKAPTDEGCEQNEYFVKMTERAVRISGALGVKWAIVHPVEAVGADEISTKANLDYNHKIYEPVIRLASSLGVGIAFENMADVDGHRRFGVTGEELSLLVDSFGDPMVAACWDFGHGNRCFVDQGAQLRKVGARLRATHVDDNMGLGKEDLHTMPYFGTVNWAKMMPLLTEIGYDGCFNYELAVCRRMPECMVEPTVRYAYEIGRHLLTLA